MVHFNRLKLCPLNLQNYSKQSQCSDSHIAELTPLHQLPCKQSACIPEDDDDEYNSKLLPVTSLNVEETVVTSLPGSSDAVSTLEETERGTSTSWCEARTLGLDLPTDDNIISSQRYPSRSHRPPTRFDDYVQL